MCPRAPPLEATCTAPIHLGSRKDQIIPRRSSVFPLPSSDASPRAGRHPRRAEAAPATATRAQVARAHSRPRRRAARRRRRGRRRTRRPRHLRAISVNANSTHAAAWHARVPARTGAHERVRARRADSQHLQQHQQQQQQQQHPPLILLSSSSPPPLTLLSPSSHPPLIRHPHSISRCLGLSLRLSLFPTLPLWRFSPRQAPTA